MFFLHIRTEKFIYDLIETIPIRYNKFHNDAPLKISNITVVDKKINFLRISGIFYKYYKHYATLFQGPMEPVFWQAQRDIDPWEISLIGKAWKPGKASGWTGEKFIAETEFLSVDSLVGLYTKPVFIFSVLTHFPPLSYALYIYHNKNKICYNK